MYCKNHQNLVSFLFITFFAGIVTSLNFEEIIGGRQIRPGSFIYEVTIQVHGAHRCSGSLIAPDVVLSAGHCFYSGVNEFVSKPYLVYAGNENIKNPKGPAMKISRIYLHTNYNEFSDFSGQVHIHHDIALLKLANSFSVNNPNSIIYTINLPDEGETFNGKNATVTGFGLTSKIINPYAKYKKDKYISYSSSLLQLLDVKILSDDDCFPDSDISYCARPFKKNSGACDGDSGGPLSVGWKLAGIVSHGPSSCNDFTSFGSYVKVSVYLKWIKEAMADKPTKLHKRIDLMKTLESQPKLLLKSGNSDFFDRIFPVLPIQILRKDLKS